MVNETNINAAAAKLATMNKSTRGFHPLVQSQGWDRNAIYRACIYVGIEPYDASTHKIQNVVARRAEEMR